MKITIHTEGWFDAAHHLKDYDGACSALHGHTYKVELWVKGEEEQLDNTGILFDFGNLKLLLKEFDHSGDMTDIMGINSTAENQALYFYKKLKSMNNDLNFKVRVFEQLQPKRSYAEVGDFE